MGRRRCRGGLQPEGSARRSERRHCVVFESVPPRPLRSIGSADGAPPPALAPSASHKTTEVDSTFGCTTVNRGLARQTEASLVALELGGSELSGCLVENR